MESKEFRSSVGFFDFVMFRAFRAFRGFSIFSRKKAKNRLKNGTIQTFSYPKPFVFLFAFSRASLRLNPIVTVRPRFKTKECRSSVGFFDFVRFRVFRGSLDGGVDRGAAKVAKGRKEEGVSEDGFSEFQ